MIAKHCARLWVEENPVDLVLLGRNLDRLQRIAADLQVRSPQSDITVKQVEFRNPQRIQQTIDELALHYPPDLVLIAHGFLSDQPQCQDDLIACHESLEINGISPLLYAEGFAKQMAHVNRGTLAIIGSVAGDRGRKTNYVYGSAKAMIAAYAQGLQHRFADTSVNIILIKPGPTDTPMAVRLKNKGFQLTPIDKAARNIVKAIQQHRAIAYVPSLWRFVMWVVRHLPNHIFNKLEI